MLMLMWFWVEGFDASFAWWDRVLRLRSWCCWDCGLVCYLTWLSCDGQCCWGGFRLSRRLLLHRRDVLVWVLVQYSQCILDWWNAILGMISWVFLLQRNWQYKYLAYCVLFWVWYFLEWAFYEGWTCGVWRRERRWVCKRNQRGTSLGAWSNHRVGERCPYLGSCRIACRD